MGVAFDTQPYQQPDAVLVGFDERMLGAAADRSDHSVHCFLFYVTGTRRFANSASSMRRPSPGSSGR